LPKPLKFNRQSIVADLAKAMGPLSGAAAKLSDGSASMTQGVFALEGRTALAPLDTLGTPRHGASRLRLVRCA
jgi:hypothetical protein